MKPIKEQTVVITGGSSGIGRETAIIAAARGANVAIAARGREALAAAAAEIGQVGSVLPITADVANAAETDAIAEEVTARWGRIDTWVNAAAVAVYGEFRQITPEEFEQVIRIDLLGVVNGTRSALAVMERQPEGGTIVNVSSGLGNRGMPLQTPYSTAKFAVNGFSEALRSELLHQGSSVRISVIEPASIDTPFFDHARSHMDRPPAPFPPVYDPAIAAEAILHAATHPVRTLPVGGASASLGMMNAIAPRLVDRVAAETGYPLQQESDADTIGGERAGNLWSGIEGPGSVRGGRPGRQMSGYTAWRLSPMMQAATLVAAAAGGLALGVRSHENRGPG
jgi:NAD(P)-dependent dehydrogenase (short-subunit alcohol dehydrogenase family)